VVAAEPIGCTVADMGQPLTIPPGFETLPVREQVQYVRALWKRIGERQQDVPSPEWHRDEVRKRLAEHQRNPGAARPWDEVRAELLARFDRGR
jgi:putative addiction module component (TIGR02574 family)